MPILLFVIGAILGSFINVLIDRLPRGEQVFGGRSYCEHCKKKIQPYDLIPIVSYLLLRGKCRNCRKKIPQRILLVEVCSGLLLTLLYPLLITNPVSFVFSSAISFILLAIAVIDIEHGIISDTLLGVLGGLTLVYIFFFAQSSFMNNLVSGFISLLFFLIIFLATRGRGIGFGDVKFAFFIGFLLGPYLTILSLYVAFLTGAAISIILVVRGRKKLRGSTVPFGPFLSFGVFVALAFGPQLLSLILPYFSL